MNLYFRPDGSAQCLYGEQITLATLGRLDIRRASHVEPDPQNPGQWYADLSPVDGPVMTGFPSRADALRAEEEWLNAKMRTTNVQAHE
jgi:hypothetical protein